MKDLLGNRMKSQYENRTKYYIPRRTYTIIRLDGKAFHSFTKGYDRPYDMNLINVMDHTAQKLCEEIQGCKLAYTQSDEISLLLTDFDKITTDAYFDGSIQKIASVAASIATAHFNDWIANIRGKGKLAYFDARVFSIPDPIEVENYFIWRQGDCVRNSISMIAQSLYSHKELEDKSTAEMQDMCIEKGVNWNDQSVGFKIGRMVIKEEYEHENNEIPKDENSIYTSNITMRSRWTIYDAIWITKEREKFSLLIPKMHDYE